MPENCYLKVFGVKEFIFDVKIAKYHCFMVKTQLENLTRDQLSGKILGCRHITVTKIFFSSVSTLHIFFENKSFLFQKEKTMSDNKYIND